MKTRLENFFDYNSKFNLINDALNNDAKKINKFHSSNVEYFKMKINFNESKESISWHFRNFRSLREIFHSALMFEESKAIENEYTITSVFFCKYYSLLHALKAVLYLTPIQNFSPRLGHAQTVNIFMDNYCQGKRKVFEKDEVIELSTLLRNLREVTSYQLPHSGSDFLSEKEFRHLEQRLSFYLIKLYQLAHYLSFVLNKVHKKVDISSNFTLFDNMKKEYFYTPHPTKKEYIDFSDKIFIRDTIRADSTYCEPFQLFLEHEEDEFLLYGGFDYLKNSKLQFQLDNVTRFIWKAFI